MSEYKELTFEDFERYFINKEEEGDVCIHCSTKEESDRFCEIMDLYKIKPIDSTKYTNTKWYNVYEEDTVYYNDGTYCDVYYAEKNRSIIFDFVDILKESKEEKDEEKTSTTDTDQEEKILKMLADVWNEYLKLDTKHPNEREYFANGINQCQSVIGMRIASNSRHDLFPIKK